MRIAQAAQQVGISPTTLKRLEQRGLIHPRKDRNGQRRYTCCAKLAARGAWGNPGRGIASWGRFSRAPSIPWVRRPASWGFPTPQPMPTCRTWSGMVANDPERSG